jgi:hypothetical protein
MKASYPRTLFLLLLVAAQGLAFPGATESGPVGQSHVETYHYQAVPMGKENEKEDVELIFSFEEDSSEYASTIISKKSDELITIKMTREGNFNFSDQKSPQGPGRPHRGEDMERRKNGVRRANVRNR